MDKAASHDLLIEIVRKPGLDVRNHERRLDISEPFIHAADSRTKREQIG